LLFVNYLILNSSNTKHKTSWMEDVSVTSQFSVACPSVCSRMLEPKLRPKFWRVRPRPSSMIQRFSFPQTMNLWLYTVRSDIGWWSLVHIFSSSNQFWHIFTETPNWTFSCIRWPLWQILAKLCICIVFIVSTSVTKNIVMCLVECRRC
jgi:hypothetical protein